MKLLKFLNLDIFKKFEILYILQQNKNQIFINMNYFDEIIQLIDTF